MQPIKISGISEQATQKLLRAHLVLYVLLKGPIEDRKSGRATDKLIQGNQRLASMNPAKVRDVLATLQDGEFITRDVRGPRTYRIALADTLAKDPLRRAMIEAFVEEKSPVLDEVEGLSEDNELSGEVREHFEKCQHALQILQSAARSSIRQTDTGKAQFDLHGVLGVAGFKRPERLEMVRLLEELRLLSQYPDDSDPKVRWYIVGSGKIRPDIFKKVRERQLAKKQRFEVEHTTREVFPEPTTPLSADQRVLSLVKIAKIRGRRIEELEAEVKELKVRLKQCELTDEAIVASDALIAKADSEEYPPFAVE